MLKDIVRYFRTADAYIDQIRSAYVAQAVCLAAIIPLAVFATRSYTLGDKRFALINLATICCNMAVLILYRISGRYNLLVYYITLFYGVFLTYFLVSGGEDGSGAYWVFTYPIVVFVVCGLYRGTIFTTLFLLSASVFLLIQPSGWPVYDYAPDHRYRIWTVLLFLSVMSFIMEAARTLTQINWLQTWNKLEAQARTDPLTGLLNRRGGMEILETEIARANRERTALSILMIDLDYFKQLNDSFGHEFGDDALVHVALLLKRHTRSTDHCVRWGGEEFLVVMPHTQPQSAAQKAEYLRRAVKDCNVISNEQGQARLTISTGIGYSMGDQTLEALLRQADNNLYEAKARGRNRVVPNFQD